MPPGGGAHSHLTTGQRLASATAAAFWIAAIFVVRGRAAGRTERGYRWGTWAIAILLGLSALANLGSESSWENYLLAPVALILAGLCIAVARTQGRPWRRVSSGPTSGRRASRG